MKNKRQLTLQEKHDLLWRFCYGIISALRFYESVKDEIDPKLYDMAINAQKFSLSGNWKALNTMKNELKIIKHFDTHASN